MFNYKQDKLARVFCTNTELLPKLANTNTKILD